MKKYIFLFTTGIVILSIIYIVDKNRNLQKKQEMYPENLLPTLINVYQKLVWPAYQHEVTDKALRDSLQKEIGILGRDTLLVFRADLGACSSCTEFFYELLEQAQEKYGNVVILTNKQVGRIVPLFEEKHGVKIINLDKDILLPIENIDDIYIFRYTKNNVANNFLIPKKEIKYFNQIMLDQVLRK